MLDNHQHTTAVSHSRAGESLSGAETLVQILADEGVDTVFGYSGGAILPVFDAIFRFNYEQGEADSPALNLVVPANEQGAAFMASGYARASGKVGVTLVTSGPGATNTVTPVRDCMADSTPIVVICGQVPTAAIGTDAFQEAPISSIMGPACKHVFLVTDPTELEATIRTAFEIARTGRPGPVVIDIPKDVQNWTGEFKGSGLLPIPGYRQRMAKLAQNQLDDSQVNRFVELLKNSQKPLIYAGGGVVNANASGLVRELSEQFSIPIVTTLMGIGAADTTSDLSLHMLGMHGTAFANYAVDECDFLIAIGARFDDRVAGVPDKFAPSAKYVAHFDIDTTEISKVVKADWHHVGSLHDSLHVLLDALKQQSGLPDYQAWTAHVKTLKQDYALNYDRESDSIQPYYVIEEINRITKGEAIIATGVGQHQMWAAQYFDFREPRLWLTSGSMGTMGFGLPAAIGAQFAKPSSLVIDIDGDGSMRMNFGELETVTTYQLPIKVVVLNNYGDGMVKQWQRLFFKGRMSASDKSLHKKNFVKAAEADGFEFARRLSNKADVPHVIKEFVEYDGPAFLEVIIDRSAEVYPMVGPGQSYKQMITGPFINARDEDGDTPPDMDPNTTEMF